MSRKRSNQSQREGSMEPRSGINEKKFFILFLIVLSTIAMVSAFFLPENIAKWIIVGTVFIAGGGYWMHSDKKRGNQDG